MTGLDLGGGGGGGEAPSGSPQSETQGPDKVLQGGSGGKGGTIFKMCPNSVDQRMPGLGTVEEEKYTWGIEADGRTAGQGGRNAF